MLIHASVKSAKYSLNYYPYFTISLIGVCQEDYD